MHMRSCSALFLRLGLFWLSIAFLSTLLPAAALAGGREGPLLTNPDVLIDVGHGGIDGGTSHGTLLEKDINLAVAARLYQDLTRRNRAVVVNRLKDYALSDDNRWLRSSRHRRDLVQRCEIANRLKPRYMISLHVNWAKSHKKSGPLVIYQKSNEASMRLALQLQIALNRLYTGGSTGETIPVPGRKYYLLKNTSSPSVIVEMGFLSHPMDRALLTSPVFQSKLALAIGDTVNAILAAAP